MTKDDLSFFLLWYTRYSPFLPANIKVEHIPEVVERYFRLDLEREKQWVAEYQAKNYPDEALGKLSTPST